MNKFVRFNFYKVLTKYESLLMDFNNQDDKKKLVWNMYMGIASLT